MKLIGIDLGTTNSAIAMVNEFGKSEIIPNKEGERITPSVVLFDDDQIIVGSIAKQSSVAEPDRTVSSIKSNMGSTDYSFEYKKNEYKPEDISAMILRKLIEDAESFLNVKITDIVLTVPAYFNDMQRKATIDAGKISGVNVLQIINEPTAAALTYGIDKDKEQKILVYDLGGGTFDITIMKIGNGNFNVLASDGDRQLGGNNFDEKLMIYLNDKFKQQHDIDMFEDPVLIQDLRFKAENSKKVLSTKLSTTVYLSAKGKSSRITVTRKLFSDQVEDFITRTELLINAVMTDAGLEWNEIDQVLLVGGSTRMPAVHDMIFRVTGKKPTTQINPDEAVALGASIQAGILAAKNENEEVNDMVRMKYGSINVSDVTAHSFGAITLDEFDNKRNAIIIPKNSKIPVRKSQIFYTSTANQSQVKMVVIQGEDPDPEFCTVIGTTTLNFPAKAENSPIIFNYEYDVNGIIQATAKDPETGKKSAIKIAREGALTNDQVDTKAQKMNTLFPRRREYMTRESFTEDTIDNIASSENVKDNTGASMVNDVFVAAETKTESFDDTNIYKKKEKNDEDILEKSEIDTVTSDQLKRELEEESAVIKDPFTNYRDTKNDDDIESVKEESIKDVSATGDFIERFEEADQTDKFFEDSLKVQDISEDEKIEKIDKELESNIMETEEKPVNKDVSSESFDDTLDEIISGDKDETLSEEADVSTDDQKVESSLDEDEPKEDISDIEDIFETLSIAESGVVEDDDDEKHDDFKEEIEDVQIGDIERNPVDNEFENISMEDSSVADSQSFDDELDEIGKSEFIIDRSEYLTDEDIMRIKEEGTIKSGVDASDLPTEQEESFTEDEVNELFSGADAGQLSTESKAEDIVLNEEKKKKDEKSDDIMDWIDE